MEGKPALVRHKHISVSELYFKDFTFLMSLHPKALSMPTFRISALLLTQHLQSLIMKIIPPTLGEAEDSVEAQPQSEKASRQSVAGQV